jgi:hypoxanthine-DNA glycosylase
LQPAIPDTDKKSKQGLPPILGESPRLLILGSMPGEASLRRGEYYGHDRNAFWPIIAEVLGLSPRADYAARTAALIANGIALWDVIAACERRGSLDAAIRPESIRVNDFAALFTAQPNIRQLLFNGGMAQREYLRRVLPGLPEPHRGIEQSRLPSTSPTYAGMAYENKLAAWRRALQSSAD